MFSNDLVNVYEADGYQYWPAWMLYNLQQSGPATFNNLPLNIISLNNLSERKESNSSQEFYTSLLPKLGFTEFRSQDRSETTNYPDHSKNSHQQDIESAHEESQFLCKRKKPIQKKKKPKRGPQNKNRNIIPSLVQQIFSFISKPTKSKSICQRAFNFLSKPQSSEISVQRYYCFIKQVKDKLNHYVNEKSLSVLCQLQEIGIGLYGREEQLFYLSLGRVLAKHFMEQVLPCLVLHSKRMFEDKRVEHLKIRRMLLGILESMDRIQAME